MLNSLGIPTITQTSWADDMERVSPTGDKLADDVSGDKLADDVSKAAATSGISANHTLAEETRFGIAVLGLPIMSHRLRQSALS
jgi:hypothetical protein